MIKAISENIDNDKVGQPENIGTTQTIIDRHIKDDNDMVTKNPAQVKEGNNEQVPIFMDQHMLNVVHRDNANDAETFEVTTEETLATEESPKEHQMPIFMNQQIVKEIVDLQKSRQQPDDLNHGDITTPQIPVRIPGKLLIYGIYFFYMAPTQIMTITVLKCRSWEKVFTFVTRAKQFILVRFI